MLKVCTSYKKRNLVLFFTGKMIKINLAVGAKRPQRATAGAAGYDVYSSENKIIKSGKTEAVDTGISMEIPEKYFGNIRSRSGLAKNHSIWVLNGVIDSDFRGTIKILLINHGKEDFVVKSGMRIAQLLFSRVEFLDIVDAKVLSETDRGAKGFGHSGCY